MNDRTGTARGAPLKELVDDSPWDTEGLAVRPRLAWLVRNVRQWGPRPVATQAEMLSRLSALGVLPPTALGSVSTLESGKTRRELLLEGYEQVLGLAPGRLRGPVAVVCRSHPDDAPRARVDAPARTFADIARVSEAVERPDRTAGDWLHWARTLSGENARGLPRSYGVQLIGTLISEVPRAMGHGYAARYEALATLRAGQYGDYVREAAVAAVDDPHVQLAMDALCAVGEDGSRRSWRWLGALLEDQRPYVTLSSSIALTNMLGLRTFRRGWWTDLTPHLLRAAAVHADGAGWSALSDLVGLMPADLRSDVVRRLPRPPMETVDPRLTGRRHAAAGRAWCHAASARITAQVGAERDPLLTRMLYDAIFSPVVTKTQSTLLVLFASAWREEIFREVVGLVAPDTVTSPFQEAVSARIAERLFMAQMGLHDDRLARWAATDERRVLRLMLAAQAGVAPAEEECARAFVQGPDAVRRAMYAVGLAAPERLVDLGRHALPEVSAAARWWLGHAGRVVDTGA